jgi:hypothetical protein
MPIARNSATAQEGGFSGPGLGAGSGGVSAALSVPFFLAGAAGFGRSAAAGSAFGGSAAAAGAGLAGGAALAGAAAGVGGAAAGLPFAGAPGAGRAAGIEVAGWLVAG